MLCGALALGSLAVNAEACAQPGQPVYDIRIRDTTLADALLELARQTNVQLLFSYDTAKKIRVSSLSGRFTFEDALTALLRDTGLTGGLVRDGVVRISPAGPASRGEEPVSPKTKATLLGGASAFIFGAFNAPSYAQQAPDQAGARDVVVVTAQRREQDLQDVPLSVSAFSAEQLEDLGVADVTEVGKFTPNVTLEVSRGTNNTLSAFIRGVGQQDPVGGFEAGVGIYLDDVYLNRPQGAVLDVFDVERIEVLRGPQGTLYGRNTIGGAVKYVTKRLSHDPYARLQLTAGDYGRQEGILTASTPLGDTFRIGAAVASLQRDGYGRNLNLGIDNYDKDVFAARASAEWDVTPDFAVRASADYLKDTSDPKQGHRLIPGQLSGTPVLSNVYDTQAGLAQPTQSSEATGGSIIAEWKLSDTWTLKNILAGRKDISSTPIDFDSLPAIDLDVPGRYDNMQTSEEFQALYSGDKLNGLVGAYYLNAKAVTVFDVVLATTGALIGVPGLNAQTYGDVNTRTWSVFGDFTYSFTEQWALSVGGRYTDDKREGVVLRRNFAGGYSPYFGGTAVAISTTSNFDGQKRFTDFSPRASLAWTPNKDQNVYFTYAKGFKGGGFDPRGQTSAAPDTNRDGVRSAQEIFDFMQFDPEKVDSFELGWKSSLQNGRFRTSLATFYMDYKDVQVPGSIGVDTNGDGINDTFTGVTTNAGAATLKGVEFDGFGHIGEDWITRGDAFDTSISLGYIDAAYDEFIGPTGTNVADQRVFQNTPKWTASARLSYMAPIKVVVPGTLSVLSSWSYRSSSSQFEAPNPYLDQGAYTLWDMSLIFKSDTGHWSVGLYGKNLTDERYKVSGYNFVNINSNGTFTPTLGREGTLTAFYGDPRTWAISLNLEY